MATYNLTDLTDPQKFKAEYPDTVHAIDPVYWDHVIVGHFVKIRRNNEYFWVQVREINDNLVTGEVYYQLGTNNFNTGDLLTFRMCYMFDIYDPLTFNLIPGFEPFSFSNPYY